MPTIRKDYTGTIIGRRTVLGLSHFTDHNDPMWQVQCRCGNTFESLTQDLKRLRCRGCTMEHRRKRPFESLYNAFVQKASKRRTVEISYDEFAALTATKECHYCGDAVEWLCYQTKTRGKKYKGLVYNLDRKDNTKAYILDNVVVCCSRCNQAKNSFFTYDEWKRLGDVIRTWKGV